MGPWPERRINARGGNWRPQSRDWMMTHSETRTSRHTLYSRILFSLFLHFLCFFFVSFPPSLSGICVPHNFNFSRISFFSRDSISFLDERYYCEKRESFAADVGEMLPSQRSPPQHPRSTPPPPFSEFFSCLLGKKEAPRESRKTGLRRIWFASSVFSGILRVRDFFRVIALPRLKRRFRFDLSAL